MSYLHQEKSSVCYVEINRQIVKKNQVEIQISVPATPALVAGDQWADLHGFFFKNLQILSIQRAYCRYMKLPLPEMTEQAL